MAWGRSVFLDRRRMSQCVSDTAHGTTPSAGLPCRPVLHRVRTTTLSPALQQPDWPHPFTTRALTAPRAGYCARRSLTGRRRVGHFPGPESNPPACLQDQAPPRCSQLRRGHMSLKTTAAHAWHWAAGQDTAQHTDEGGTVGRAGLPGPVPPRLPLRLSRRVSAPRGGTRHSAAAERGAGRWPLCEAYQGQSLFCALTTRPSCSRGKTEESRGARRIKPTTKQSHRQGLRRCREESAFHLVSGFWASSRPHLCPGSL